MLFIHQHRWQGDQHAKLLGKARALDVRQQSRREQARGGALGEAVRKGGCGERKEGHGIPGKAKRAQHREGRCADKQITKINCGFFAAQTLPKRRLFMQVFADFAALLQQVVPGLGLQPLLAFAQGQRGLAHGFLRYPQAACQAGCMRQVQRAAVAGHAAEGRIGLQNQAGTAAFFDDAGEIDLRQRQDHGDQPACALGGG